MASTLTAFEAVRGRIAAAVLPVSPQERLGSFRLREDQRHGAVAVRRALHTHGGALVADAVGSGKTVLALAVAAAYPDVLVIAPAAVREQWRAAAVRASVHIRIASHDALSRGQLPAAAAFIVVDEAHHFRNRNSQRFRALAMLARGRHLLLLTATPVVNRRADRDALLSLFLGTGAQRGDVVEAVVLRGSARPQADIVVRRLPALQAAAEVPGVTDCLSALPPPLPTADGSAATALVRVVLAMAWSSSLVALDTALRRRLQRAAGIADVLRAGRWPTRHALRDWVLGDDATQLAMPLETAGLTMTPPADALATLAQHCEAVRALRARIAPRLSTDVATRAASLRALLAAESPRRVLVLAQHASTIRALYAALRTEPGVVAITGARVHAAAGRWTRDEVLRALGPHHGAWQPHDPRGIRLLLATDILAEGVELQGCATVVHGDPVWTPARLEQRVGRVAREGQRDDVHVTEFHVPAGAQELLALRPRLLGKRRAGKQALARADDVTALRDALRGWQPPDTDAPAVWNDDGPLVAAAASAHDGFIAVLDAEQSTAGRLIAGVCRDGRWRVSTRAALIHSLVRGVAEPLPVTRNGVRVVRWLLGAWRRREMGRVAVRGGATLPPDLMRSVARRLDAWLHRQPLAQRSQAVHRADLIRTGISNLRGVGAEAALVQALREADAAACVPRLEDLVANGKTSDHTVTARLSALLILRRRSPADPAPLGSSPESAAIR